MQPGPEKPRAVLSRWMSDLGRRLASRHARPLDDESRMHAQIAACARAHIDAPYFRAAEVDMDQQWRDFILPVIDGMDFRRVLELAPGHGRNTVKLLERASEIHLVDVNESCIAACRERFGEGTPSCRIHYHVGDGHSLGQVADSSVTLVYSWDSMVHFDKRVVRSYVLEFARVLEPGGTGFVHHSNYGALSNACEDWKSNPSWRSNMTRELFADYCAEAGLEVIDQRLLWWFIDDLDCLSTFRKPA